MRGCLCSPICIRAGERIAASKMTRQRTFQFRKCGYYARHEQARFERSGRTQHHSCLKAASLRFNASGVTSVIARGRYRAWHSGELRMIFSSYDADERADLPARYRNSLRCWERRDGAHARSLLRLCHAPRSPRRKLGHHDRRNAHDISNRFCGRFLDLFGRENCVAVAGRPIRVLGSLKQHRRELTQHRTIDHETAPVSPHNRTQLSGRERWCL